MCEIILRNFFLEWQWHTYNINHHQYSTGTASHIEFKISRSRYSCSYFFHLKNKNSYLTYQALVKPLKIYFKT